MLVSWQQQGAPGLTREQIQQIQDQAREAAQQAREQAQQAREQAQQAREQARDQARDEIQRVMRELARQGITTRRGGDRDFVFTQPPPGFPGSDVIPQGAIILGLGFFVACVVTIIGLPIARAIGRRMDRKTQTMSADSPDTRARLERIEQAVDAIALEVERISEGQRFSSQILADMRARPSPNPLENGIPVTRREKERVVRR
jgi:hypothetical protein